MKRSLAAAVALAVLSGCSSMPADRDSLPDTDVIQKERQADWMQSRDPVTRVSGRSGLQISERYPVGEALGRRELDLEFPPTATLEDLAAILNEEDVKTLIRGGGEATGGEEEGGGSQGGGGVFADTPVDLARFEGTVDELVRVLREVRDVAVEYRGGYLLIRPDARYILSAPQNEDLVDRLTEQIEGLGGLAVRGDLDAGVITYRATPNDHSSIQQYVERAAGNAAVVHLQMALLDVRLNRDRRQGFNWSQLSIEVGDRINDSLEGATGNAIALTRQGLSFSREIDGLSIAAVLDALSEYGQARTEQDITLTTVAGAPVEIRSGSQVPFVGEVTATAVPDVGTTSGANVEIQETGLEVSIVPRYDASTDLVTSQIDMEMTDVVQMREFDVGDGATLTSPELQDLAFTNISRLRPGEATLVGGIAFDQVDENYSSIAGLEDVPAGSERISTSRHAMFILLRPTVTVFTDDGDDLLPIPGPIAACDPEAVTPAENERLVNLSAAYFRPGAERLDGQAARHLEQVAQMLRDHPQRRVELVGYTGADENETERTDLGGARSGDARDRLDDAGVDLARIETHAGGLCRTRSGEFNDRDRRVEVWVIEPRAAADPADPADPGTPAPRDGTGKYFEPTFGASRRTGGGGS